MDMLAVKLAEKLDIALENAVELYPVLREQFVIYKVLESIFSLSSFASILLGTGLVAYIIFIFIDWEWCSDNEKSFHKKMLIILSIIVATLAIITVFANILSFILAPDFLIIKSFIK